MRQLETTLGECLDALLQGATVEQCLARYPGQADELAPLLGLAAQIAQTRPLTMSQAGFERGRSRVRAAIAQARAERAAAAPPHGPIRALVARLSPQEHQPERSPTGWLDAALLTAIGLAVTVLVIMTSPTNSPLYPLRSLPEKAVAWLLGTPGPVEIVRPIATDHPPTPTAGPTVTPTEPLSSDTPPVSITVVTVATATPTSPSGSTTSTTTGATPTWTPNSTTHVIPGSVTPPPTQTAVLTHTLFPTPTTTYAPSATITPSPTRTPSLTWTVEPPTTTPVPAETPVATDTPSPRPTSTVPPTRTPGVSPSPSPTSTPLPTHPPLPTATAARSSALSSLRLVDEVQLTRREYAVFRTWSPDGAFILFTVPRPPEAGDPNDREIWVMSRDGADQRQLAAGQSPTFSPDGQRVAYTAGGPAGRAVWIVPVVGGEPQRVVGEAGRQAFWPTGDTLLYSTVEGLKAVTLTPAGTLAGKPEVRVPLAGLVEEPQYVRWSVAPHGGAAVFGAGSRWWVARLAPGETPQLYELPVRLDVSYAWTHDGTAFAFAGAAESFGSGLYLMGAEGSGPRLLVTANWFSSRGVSGMIKSLTWAPDGSVLVVEWWSGRSSEDSLVYVADRAGRFQPLDGLGAHENLHWSPDGQVMAFHRNGNIWLAHVEGP